MKNILTIDVEEVFHAEYARNVRSSGNFAFRTSHNMKPVLKLLNEFNTKATFFLVGKVAERCRDTVKDIVDAGHEVAFHSYDHEPLWKKNPKQLEMEIEKFERLMVDVTKDNCAGFRAPSFSLDNGTKWALDVLERAGMLYDSSVFPVRTPLYGISNAPVKPYKPCKTDLRVEDGDGKLWEFPLAVYSFLGLRIPAAGGFYLRAAPVFMSKAIRKLNDQGFPAVIFVHSWELDSETPKLRLSPYESFVTYHNISETSESLKRLLQDFRFTSFREYMKTAGIV